ncbi:hypothetical protein CBR_g12965 [Chara braunii]|uniref:Peptidase A2 domain-containing protein n=1 Tax=Chara braunii TaxID=69332 RepID=A0A388KT67_CHABU|nr:hypothetical protein CBR_g12965 [Chara braunii]|eukprot:GBG73247.1 hypothetical protein CBR_g12965 [Chara braunii]
MRRVRLRGQVIEKFPLGEERGHELFNQCWESRKDTDFEWWACVGEFIKPLFSGQVGDVDRDLIRRCAQEGVRGISDLEIANLALTASEEKKLRDSWWTVTSEESGGESANEDSSEEKGGSEEEENSEDTADSREGDEPEGVAEAARGVPVESRWADLMDAKARLEEAREFPRDRQGYRPLRRGEEECQDRRDLREGRSVEAGGRPRRWVERGPEVVTGERCVMFMLHLPEEKRKEVLEKAPRDSANFEKVAEVVFTGGGVDVREYMKETLDMSLSNMRDTVAPLRRTLMQPMQCTLLEYLAASKSAKEELLSITRKVRVPLAGGPTVPVEGPAKEEVHTSLIIMEELPANFFSGEEAKKFYALGSGQLQAVVSGKKMRALVDNGSESTVCRDSIARELGLEIDRGVSMSMVVDDNKLQPAEGVCHSPVIEVASVEATVPIFSVKECSSELILGRTWLSAVHATTVDLSDGSQTLSIQSPDGIRVVLKTVDAQDERNRTSIARRKVSQSRVCRVRLAEVPLADRGPKGDQLEIEDVGDRIIINSMGYEKEDEEEEFGGVKKHKTVAEKVKPAAVSRDRTGEATISEEEITDIIRKKKEPEGQRITVDRLAKMDIRDGNLTEEEKGFIAMTLRGCDKAIAFDESERGRIDPRYAKPARIHTVSHVPWKDRPQ